MNIAFIWGLFLSSLMLASHQSLVSAGALTHTDRSGTVPARDRGKAARAQLSGSLLADVPSAVELLWRALLLEVTQKE